MKNLNEFRATEKGQRNDSLKNHVRNVFMFYRYLSDYSQEEILTMFREPALTLGLGQSEIEATMHSAMKFGLQHQKTLI